MQAVVACLAVYSTFKRRPYSLLCWSVCDDHYFSDAQKHMCPDEMRSYKEICVLCSPSGCISSVVCTLAGKVIVSF